MGQNHRYEEDIAEMFVHSVTSFVESQELLLLTAGTVQTVKEVPGGPARWLRPKVTHYLGKRESLKVSKLPSTGGAFSTVLKGPSAVL